MTEVTKQYRDQLSILTCLQLSQKYVEGFYNNINVLKRLNLLPSFGISVRTHRKKYTFSFTNKSEHAVQRKGTKEVGLHWKCGADLDNKDEH